MFLSYGYRDKQMMLLVDKLDKIESEVNFCQSKYEEIRFFIRRPSVRNNTIKSFFLF